MLRSVRAFHNQYTDDDIYCMCALRIKTKCQQCMKKRSCFVTSKCLYLCTAILQMVPLSFSCTSTVCAPVAQCHRISQHVHPLIIKFTRNLLCLQTWRLSLQNVNSSHITCHKIVPFIFARCWVTSRWPSPWGNTAVYRHDYISAFFLFKSCLFLLYSKVCLTLKSFLG